MNQYLDALEPYPFERLNALKSDLETKSASPHISLSLGEPKHDPPDWILSLLSETARIKGSLRSYPATRGLEELREAIAAWLRKRYDIEVNPNTQVLPVNGTREGLFSFGQSVLSGRVGTKTLIPNPFYQIYEGSCLLRGSEPHYVPGTITPNFHSVPEDVWDEVELLYVCSPNNPSGAIVDDDTLKYLVERAQTNNFIIAADECYSEIYLDESSPPPGLLQAAAELGVSDYHNCVVFNSLSKRSSCPGLRSGFAAGSAEVLSSYYHYRTYHGSTMSNLVQEASVALWSDEDHVATNRAIYREKFQAIQPLMEAHFETPMPDGAFYYWPDLNMNDEIFAKELFLQENITVLPGSYLGRTVGNRNPGENRIRIALVASLDECIDAITRLCDVHSRLQV